MKHLKVKLRNFELVKFLEFCNSLRPSTVYTVGASVILCHLPVDIDVNRFVSRIGISFDITRIPSTPEHKVQPWFRTRSSSKVCETDTKCKLRSIACVNL